jgi:hypothetical protein
MGIIADSVLEAGGKVFGVIPETLVSHEVAHLGCTELYTVANMHERKAKMTELTDAFVALPAGSARSTNYSRHGPGMRLAITPSHSACSTSTASGAVLTASWTMSATAVS